MNLYQAASYLRHLLTARSTAGYGVHSPFMFDFLGEVIRAKTDPDIIKSVERLRREMLDDKRVISITDLGAGPSGKKRPVRKISEIAATAALPVREAGLLARTVKELRIKNYELRIGEQGSGSKEQGAWSMEQGAQSTERGARGMGHGARGLLGANDESCKAGELGEESKEFSARYQEIGNGDRGIILELGTSLGISTLAMALAAEETKVVSAEGNPALQAQKTKVVSVEGCPALAALARENLDRHGAGNIRLLNMEFDDALEKLREEGIKVSFAFIDGNHRGEALMHYVHTIRELGEEMIIVADDIHLNRDMYRAWNCLATSGTVPVTLETFRFGILFFLNKLTPGRYRIRY